MVLSVDAPRDCAILQALRAAGFDAGVVTPNDAPSRLQQESVDYLIGSPDALEQVVGVRATLAVLDVAQSLVSESTLATISAALLRHVRQHGGDVAWLVIEDESALLEIAGATPLRPRQLADIGHKLLDLFAGTREPRLVSVTGATSDGAVQEDRDAAALLVEGEWCQLLVIPLVVRNRRIGAVFSASRSGALRAGAADLLYLGILASLAATAIENTRLYHRAKTQSLTDQLTGLPNARSLSDVLPRMLAQASRARRPFSLVLIDSDSAETSSGLKSVNDRYGHEAGDQLIVQIARTIKRGEHGVRSSDMVVRYTGGDEFLVLMPDTDTEQAMTVAERLRSGVDQTAFDVAGHVVHCTISLGVATFPEDGSTPDDLIRAADQAMYEAKRLGKNRVVVSRTDASRTAAISARRSRRAPISVA
jgi:diguanylate cyclase (GGDEF)-like protein